VVFEPRLGEMHRPDFAVTDPVFDQRLAYFEVKVQLTPATQHRVFVQLKAYANAARAVGASVYLATPAQVPTSEEPFDFYRVDKDDSVQPLPQSLFPNYRSLSSDVIAIRKEKIESSREKTKDHFQFACWFLAGVVLILTGLDFIFDRYMIELIDTNRLTLLGITVALIVIPFAQKFKILGIEYERYMRKREIHHDKS